MSLLDRFDTAGPLGDDERAELDRYRMAFATLAGVAGAAANGDLEQRVPALGDEQIFHDVRSSINLMLDLTDAFVREAGSSLQAASEGRFHRAFLLGGLRGSFRDGARTVNIARRGMAAASTQLAEAERARSQLADSFESAVLAASEQVAAASTELGATASYLTAASTTAVREADAASGAIRSLSESSQQIRRVVTFIQRVASQSKMLALNATVEAARAGEAGRAFGVVATEVKQLAMETGKATEEIEAEIAAVQHAAARSGEVLTQIADTIRDMNQQILGIQHAVEGGRMLGTGMDGQSDFTGLSQLSELLRAEIVGFLAELRSAPAG